MSILLTATEHGSAEHGTAGKTPAGYPFFYIINSLKSGQAARAKGLYAVALPFTAAAHLLGIPKNSGDLISSDAVPSNMELVSLEGNYSEHFTLFVETGGQADARYILDPEAMAHSIDFINTFHWELEGSTLYFLDDSSLPPLAVVDAFIEQIVPANTAQQAPTIQQIHKKEILSSVASKLLCPHCQTQLRKGKNWLACPEGHGYLLTGSQLLEIRLDSASFTKQLSQSLGRAPKIFTDIKIAAHKEIICPHCSTMMVSAPYQHSEIIMDRCPNCQYRWIDGVELNTILGAYRHE